MSLRVAAYCWAVAASRLARARAWPAVLPASNSSQVNVSPADQSPPLVLERGRAVEPQQPPPARAKLPRLVWELLPPALAKRESFGSKPAAVAWLCWLRAVRVAKIASSSGLPR